MGTLPRAPLRPDPESHNPALYIFFIISQEKYRLEKLQRQNRENDSIGGDLGSQGNDPLHRARELTLSLRVELETLRLADSMGGAGADGTQGGAGGGGGGERGTSRAIREAEEQVHGAGACGGVVFYRCKFRHKRGCCGADHDSIAMILVGWGYGTEQIPVKNDEIKEGHWTSQQHYSAYVKRVGPPLDVCLLTKALALISVHRHLLSVHPGITTCQNNVHPRSSDSRKDSDTYIVVESAKQVPICSTTNMRTNRSEA